MDIHPHQQVSIPVDHVTLTGDLIIPLKAKAIIIFAHGSGSSRLSIRNQKVAEYLHERDFGTLLFDLLTEEEDKDYDNRFDIDMLSKRLVGVTKWLKKLPDTKDYHLGYFGASTGAASALQAAAQIAEIGAVVSRGGRPDLASLEALQNVHAPTLLIVGSLDHDVLQLNKATYLQLECEKKLEVVDGATHLFEEPGKMEIVSELAGNWFDKHLITVKV